MPSSSSAVITPADLQCAVASLPAGARADVQCAVAALREHSQCSNNT